MKQTIRNRSLSLTVLLSLAACGGENTSTLEQQAPQENNELFTVTEQGVTDDTVGNGMRPLGNYIIKNAVLNTCAYRDGDDFETRPCSDSGIPAFRVYQTHDNNYHICLQGTFTSFREGDGTELKPYVDTFTAKCIVRGTFNDEALSFATRKLAQRYVADESVRTWPGDVVLGAKTEFGFALSWRGSSRGLTRKDSNGHIGLYSQAVAINQQWNVEAR